MKRILCCFLILPLVAVSWVGCGTTGATRGPAPGDVTGLPPDTTDFGIAAEALVKSLLEKGVLDKVPNPPARLYVVAPVNNTSEHFDTDLLTKKIRIALSDSGKTVTVLNPFDPVDFTLSGKIISTYVRVGNVRQRTYTFQMTLTDPSGTAVWEGVKEVTKSQKRGGLGF